MDASVASRTPPATDSAPIIDVSQLIERQPLRWFVLRLILVSWFVTFLDGYDMNAIAFAAPYLQLSFGFSKPELGNLFLSGNLGALFGGVLFGIIGDRIGRRRAILSAVSLFAVLTLLLALSNRYWQLLGVRFLDGVALGGVLPLIWALSIEYVPGRYRATVVTLVMLGYGIGLAAAGPISVALAPRFGWQALFIVGGGASLVSAALVWRALPESLRFLASKEGDATRMAQIVRRLAPGEITEGSRFVLTAAAPPVQRGSRRAALFRGRLRLITPLLWAAYAASSINTFFFANWGPLFFEQMGLTRAAAAFSTSLNSLAGATGAVILMRFTDRIGAQSVALMPALAVPVLLVLGVVHLAPSSFMLIMVALYLFLGSAHYGVISIAGTFYPTPDRALGSGWTASVGKLGSVIAPPLGTFLLSAHMPARRAFLVLAVFPTLFSACVFAIAAIDRRRVSGAAD